MAVRILENLKELATLIGQEVAVSDWLTISQGDIDAFATLTHDRQWIHIDPERAARESPYGMPVAHGFFTLALVSHLHGSSIQVRAGCRRVINYGLERVRFPAPVLVGSALRSRSVLQHWDEQPDFVQVTWQITIEIQGQTKPALVAIWIVRMYRS